jgi:hypothetical protein
MTKNVFLMTFVPLSNARISIFHKLCLVLAVEQVCVDNLKMRPQRKSPRSCGFFEKTVRTRLTDSNPHSRRRNSRRNTGGSAGPLRSGKGTTFEGRQRVLTILWWSDRIEPNTIQELG